MDRMRELHHRKTVIWLAALFSVLVLSIGTVGAIGYAANHSPYNGEGR